MFLFSPTVIIKIWGPGYKGQADGLSEYAERCGFDFIFKGPELLFNGAQISPTTTLGFYLIIKTTSLLCNIFVVIQLMNGRKSFSCFLWFKFDWHFLLTINVLIFQGSKAFDQSIHQDLSKEGLWQKAQLSSLPVHAVFNYWDNVIWSAAIGYFHPNILSIIGFRDRRYESPHPGSWVKGDQSWEDPNNGSSCTVCPG